ncbi:uncharacterized protein [Porites lutea]|uniref:uncharacterized protein isoform X1 n=1 Tax=Porites lutea TaxID=51062 RepID=UPI003CC6C6A5
MARLLLLFIAAMILAAHASLIPGDSLSELEEIDGEETADVPENEMPEEELGEEDFDDGEDLDEMPEEVGEVHEGQLQEDTSDTAITPGEDAKRSRRLCYYRYHCRYCLYRWRRCRGSRYRRRRCRYHVCYGCRRFCIYPYYRRNRG